MAHEFQHKPREIPPVDPIVHRTPFNASADHREPLVLHQIEEKQPGRLDLLRDKGTGWLNVFHAVD
jgi:hypothetical protein